MRNINRILLSLTLLPHTLFAEVVAKPVEYTEGDDVLKGYLAYDDDAKRQRPGVLVVHECWSN